ncbi:glycerophosphoryl diester phosphodiesterase [Alicyclobacillus contaminans]|nr:glycerophosphoryl diester phosphodiesterase [Alicyclobacillus contaminans]
MVQRVHPYLADSAPVVLAHRGNSAQCPANTLCAFEAALAAGAEIIETDMHWTKDGVMVLCHDEVVDHVSDGCGAIRTLTLAELKSLDFGYRFSPDGGVTHPFRGQGITIPTLEEALAAFPTARFNIDVKPKQPGSLRQLLKTIHALGAESRVLLASFHDSILRQIRAMNRGIATSASVRETFAFCRRVWMRRSIPDGLPYLALQVPQSMRGVPVVTARFVDAAHRAGVKVHVWTVDEPDRMRKLLDMGADGLVTNRPETAVAVRAEWLRTTIA